MARSFQILNNEFVFYERSKFLYFSEVYEPISIGEYKT